MEWENLKSYIDKILSFSHCSFSRERILNFEQERVSTDCSGIIHLLLELINNESIPKSYKAFEIYNHLLLSTHSSSYIHHVREGMILLWKKKLPPKSGDTGHCCIVYQAPIEIVSSRKERREFEIEIFEVSKNANGPQRRKLRIQTDLCGRMKGVLWNKWKQTNLIAHDTFSQKRPKCIKCQRVISLCYCFLLPQKPWASPPITIIRHPSELKHPLGSVKILENSFNGLEILDNEIVNQHSFSKKVALIYPSEKAIEWDDFKIQNKEEIENFQFILLDGTWKKTKKILYSNSWLQSIPHLKIQRDQLPQYKIRKELSSEHYSTLEVFSELWTKVDSQARYKGTRLEEIFHFVIDHQLKKIGADKYNHNYQHYPGFIKRK